MESKNSFDRMVLGISQKERIAMLKKLEFSVDTEAQSLESYSTQNDEKIDIKVRLDSEPVTLKLWLYLKSLFSSMDKVRVYNDYLVSRNAQLVEKKFLDLVDFKRACFLTGFYNHLRELKKAADYFAAEIAQYEQNPGAFYVLLGELLLPEVSSRIETQVSPFSLPQDKMPSSELRLLQLRKMEDIFQEITAVDRNRLYDSVRNLDWLRQFVNLPFEKFLVRFVSVTPGVYTCPFASVSSELPQFAKVLCNGKRIPTEILEALYMMSAQGQSNDVEADVKKLASKYVAVSMEKISTIKMFLLRVPLRLIVGTVFRTYNWAPNNLDGVEDWFIKYKNQWRKVFDQQWEIWLKQKQKDITLQKIKVMLSVSDMPLLPEQPWEAAWEGIVFSRAYSIGFLYSFFAKVYPQLSNCLKIVVLEGDFLLRENRVDFTDAYNELNHQSANVTSFAEKLSVKGNIGRTFTKIIEENKRTIQVRSQIDTIMKALEADATNIATQFGSACRSMQLVLGGLLNESVKGRYETLANIASIGGKNNPRFRQELANTKTGIDTAYEILKEIETFEIRR